MPHALEVKIGAVRRQAARLVWSIALSRLFGILVAVLLTWSVLDYLIRFQDRGVRIIGSLTALGVAGWAVRRFSQTVRGAHFQLVDIALRVERSFPALQDRLASTIQFLHEREDDPEAGSASLRRAVIAETSAQIEGLDLEQVLEPRPANRAMATAGAIACLALASVAMHPLAARTAIMRLLNPWGDVNWPQTHHLAVKAPVRRLAAGRALEVTVVDAEDAPLPEEVWLHLRYAGEGDSPHEVVEPMRFVNGEMVARKEGVSKPLSYRAVGGDDRSMSWIDLEVVEPPAIEQLSVKLRYPEYTGWTPASSQRHLRALSGTRVEMSGRATKPISSASVELDDETSIPGRIEADGNSFSIPASAKPGARVWAEHPVRMGPDGRHLPIIAMHYAGSGKVVFHATDETWRWRFRVGDVFFARYWVQTIRYLSRSKLLGKDRSAELTVDRREYRRGEPVRVRVRFLDDRQAPPEDDGVTVVIEHVGDKNRRLVLHRGGSRGVFEGTFSNPSDGQYHLWIAAPSMPGEAPAADFQVVAPPGERARLQTDIAELRRASAETKGRFYTFATADRLLADLPQGRQVKTDPLPPIVLWNHWLLAPLLLGLLISEWLLRKWGGML